MNGPYRAGSKSPHATVYRHTEHDPPQGTLVAVATGCAHCGHGTTGQQLADALNAQHGDTEDSLAHMLAQVAALVADLPREERRQRLNEAYRAVHAIGGTELTHDVVDRAIAEQGYGIKRIRPRTSGGVELTEEVLDRAADEAERGYSVDQIRPRGDAAR